MARSAVGSAVAAAIVAPLLAGYVIDGTGNGHLPFLMPMGLLLLGLSSAFPMHPETPFKEGDARAVASGPLAAAYKNRQQPVFSGIDGAGRAGDKPAE